MSKSKDVQWVASKQSGAGIEWHVVTSERYYEMLGAVPPVEMSGGAFLVGEPQDHAPNGLPRYDAFRRRGDHCEESSRPMTCDEFFNAVNV